MAMTIKTDGLEDLNKILSELENRTYEVAAAALYEGAGVVADAFAKATNSIRTAPFKGKRNQRLPSPEEKAMLQGKTGIAKFNNTGEEIETLIGVSGAAGYAMLGNTPKAVRLVARSINSGTSFMKKQPVYRNAKAKSQNAAKQAIVNKAEEMFDEIINK